MRIDQVTARAILDTRGKPTIEATIRANTCTAIASVPSGKSTGTHEAVELRDPDGGVTHAVENITTEIATALVGKRFESPEEIDSLLLELDGTPNKSRLGANAILSVSIASARLSAEISGVPLWKSLAERGGFTPGAPRLYMNVMNGGVHADFHLPFQEYILVVEGNTSEAYPVAEAAFSKLGEMLGDVPMGDEGGYAPTFDTLEKPFELLAELVAEFPHTSIAIDAAASEFYKDGAYTLLGERYTADTLHTVYTDLARRYPIHSIEDPFDEEATSDFARLTKEMGEKVLIVGDDFTVTNPARIKAAKEAEAITAVLIKPNQIGSVKEALQAVRDTATDGWQAIASHRSGETHDTFIADFAYGVGAHGIKAGGLGQKERLEKYKRLLAIEHEV